MVTKFTKVLSKISDPTGPSSIARRMMDPLWRNNVESVLQHVANWQRGTEFYSYREELMNRTRYLLGSMQSDMINIISDYFPKTGSDISDKQLNIRLFRKLTKSKAKVFCSSGTRFFLVNDAGEEVESDAFTDMITEGRFKTAFKDADLFVQGCDRTCVKLEWNKRRRCVRPQVWPAQLVHVAVNPAPGCYGSVDDAHGVMFELPPESGYANATDSRYEVWVIDPITGQTAHYISGSREKEGPDGKKTPDWYEDAINEDGMFPFVDPETKEPIYPFVWWQADDLDAVYHIGSEDALTVNRNINLALTDMMDAIHHQAWPTLVISRAEGSAGESGKQVPIGPRDVIELAEGESADFLASPLDAKQVFDIMQSLMMIDAMMDGQNPQAVRVEGTEAQSGYALKVQNVPLTEHRMDMVEVLRPYVEDTLRRAVIVWNYYAPSFGRELIPEGLRPKWEPGDIDIPVDDMQEEQVWALKYSSNVATPADRLMGERDVDKEEAIKMLGANAALNKELARAGSVDIEMSDRPEIPGGEQPDGEPVEPEDDDQEDEK